MTNLLRDVISDRRRPVRTTQSLEHVAGASSLSQVGGQGRPTLAEPDW